MTPEHCNAFCADLPATTHVVQWGGSDVWKVGGKVFAIAGWGENRHGEAGHFAVSFKVSETMFEALRDHPDCRPAPYLASRGMKWIQYYRGDAMGDDELLDHIAASYRIIAAALPKKTQKALGL
ncbi:MAG: MmcQ/YjbR family DNA-binding protein [Asticcacaulis sp.]